MTTEILIGDCIEQMRGLESGSVDAIITDPPYGTVRFAQLDGWSKESTAWDTAINSEKMFSECNRLLRTGGSLILFSQEPYTSHLITNTHGNMPFAYRMVWLKDHFANSLIAKTAPVNYTEDVCVFFKKYDTMAQHPLRIYFKEVMDFIGLGLKQINTKLGHRKAEHCFYVTPRRALMSKIGQKADHVTRIGSTQFGLCTEETYKEIIHVFDIDNMPGFKPYHDLLEINRRFNRRFNLPQGKKYKSNVLEYKKDYTGQHPTQKPIALMEDLVKTYTNEGDTVLDFTCGSGTTGVACEKNGRNFIGIELDPEYAEIARKRIEAVKYIPKAKVLPRYREQDEVRRKPQQQEMF